MRALYLIRHASPMVQPTTPAPEWPLSERGIEEALKLAATAEGWGLRVLYCSLEPKALTTAGIIGDATGTPPLVVEGLEELRIDHWVSNSDEFSELVRAVLDEPALAQRGCESADGAATRFGLAVKIIEQGAFPAGLVSHGRVMTAWLARALSVDEPFKLWRSIPMPGWCCVDLDDLSAGFVSPFS